ncbi:MAG TPA: 23S rRNA (pseudouridine(1915)-N(3))-methyltransferase RlmH [Polyangiaceae bacterium]|nr:23S rRNA (pseudouridine(1915)-N(3))-methyltransferase RlmH [Polyangiaceae bacterium]
MKFVVVAVGKVKEPPMRASIDDYLGRIRRYAKVEEVEIEDGPAPKLEAALLKAAGAATLVPLDSSGKEHDSRGFASFVEKLASTGKGDVAFLIGGKAGLGKPILDRGASVLSLSKMTFPHRLARLMLVEQLYRAMTLLRGEPYGARE